MNFQKSDKRSDFTIGEKFSRDVTFDKEAVVRFAAMAGDSNPLHHDEAFAKSSRFKGLIASGTHTTAIMMGTLAAHVCERAFAVGLSYSVKLKKAVLAGEKATIVWEVVNVEYKESLHGDIVTFEGTLCNERGEVALFASCANLIFSRSAS